MKIRIKAVDTLFFKDGKPFSMGDETWADGIFPPPPSVIYGALRTAYFGENPNDFVKANTNNDPTKNLKITAVFFEYGNENYLPLPLDYVRKKNDDENRAYLINPTRSISIRSSLFTDYFLLPDFDDEVESIEYGLITGSSMKRYFTGTEKEVIYKNLNDLTQLEPKTGIGRNNLTHTSDEGKLYRVGMRRLSEKKGFNKVSNDLSIILEFEGLELNPKGFIKLGAEGKIASYETMENNITLFEPEELSKILDKKFKLYLLTPALFKNGWQPDLTNHPLLKDLELELITACIGKPQNFGGFDLQKKMPKPMRKAVTAGSVYYLKSHSQTFQQIFNQLNGNSISDYAENEGFGIVYAGRII